MGWVIEIAETLVEGRWVEARSEMGEGERGGRGGSSGKREIGGGGKLHGKPAKGELGRRMTGGGGDGGAAVRRRRQQRHEGGGGSMGTAASR